MAKSVIERSETTTSLGGLLARSIAEGNRTMLLGLLAPDVDFRAVTPSRSWESRSAEEVADVIIGLWFGGERHIDAVERVECDTVADRERVGYRFLATTPDGKAVVEQQAYLDVHDGMITALRIACSGYRRIDA